MHTVHYGHSCVMLDTGTARLLIDPGTYSTGFEGARDLTAVLITHQHVDHLDAERLPALMAANQGAELVVDPGSAPTVSELGLPCTVVSPGDEMRFGGIRVDVIGGDHATIYGALPGIPNVGYLVDGGAFLHPGDSFALPGQEVDVLGVPTAAPWLKLAEAIDFFHAVAPRVAVPIHEALLTTKGFELMVGLLDRTKPDGAEVMHLVRGEPTKL